MRKILWCMLLTIAISCTTPGVKINESIITELAKHDFKIPSVHGFALIFICCKENYKAFTNINVLHKIFIKHYSEKYPDFRSFLSEVLNQSINFSEKDLDNWQIGHFKLDTNVQETYAKLAMPDFIARYFDSTEDKKVLAVKTEYHKDAYSILYYCFINNYKITLNDYQGKYFISGFFDRQ
ncbi:hypothetical protein [Pedobacter sp. UBA5917]|uniref:hypothetical protein n=1 Tax=Pedobacter sp. UBA5917 TaxID=1947061 RepID=UPI0025E3CE25|nr:hypothetical protein [Pedobacter sp. UBA5917]